ncbi:hypothetical protein EDC94DRAFT_585196 [Helicostylum pulchrum]|nr:hypothetical protein EDC94DRAFT_585196 [Helicostylum pulchrum]
MCLSTSSSRGRSSIVDYAVSPGNLDTLVGFFKLDVNSSAVINIVIVHNLHVHGCLTYCFSIFYKHVAAKKKSTIRKRRAFIFDHRFFLLFMILSFLFFTTVKSQNSCCQTDIAQLQVMLNRFVYELEYFCYFYWVFFQVSCFATLRYKRLPNNVAIPTQMKGRRRQSSFLSYLCLSLQKY